MEISQVAEILAVVGPVCVFAGWINHLMMKSELYDYDKELRRRMHESRDALSDAIHKNSLDIERIKAKLNGGSKP